MRKVVIICLFVCFCFPVVVKAQKEINIWYFGYSAGLNFNTNPVSVLTDGKLSTREGVTTICDAATGKLLFYSEGSLVWNAHHEVMPNGYGLKGDPTSVQSAIAVPFPGHPGQYYLFTNAEYRGLNYSVVDMALDNGNGDIIAATKNTRLLDDDASTEKVAAARHCNGRDFWIVTHTKDNADFHVYLLTDAGISSEVIYTIGSPIRLGGWETGGYLKFSPDGSILAHTFGAMVMGESGKTELLHFDNQTGVISGPITTLSGYFPQGVEFTSGGLLYISSLYGDLYQYDMKAPDVNASRITVGTANNVTFGGLQMGPDGRIYIGFEQVYEHGYRYVGLIHNPNVRGTGCNFEQDAIDMDPGGVRRTSLSFPTFINSFVYFPADFKVTGTCIGSPATFQLLNTDNVTDIVWDFGDGGTSREIAPEHTFVADKDYAVTVKVTRKCTVGEKTQVITIDRPKQENVSVALCDGTSYKLPDGRSVDKKGTYTSTFISATGCDSIITTEVNLLASYRISEAISICGQEYLLPDGRKVNRTGDYTSSLKTYQGCDSIINTHLVILGKIMEHRYDTICKGQSFVLPDGKSTGRTGVYETILAGSNGCDSIVVTHLQVNEIPNIRWEDNICLFGNRPVTITLPPDYKSYLWQDGNTSSTYTIYQPGTYAVEVSNDCGSVTNRATATICSPDLFVPNAFTPNGDGYNDLFRLMMPHGQELLEFRIFNRFGGELFCTTNIQQGWDGTFKGALQPLGAYVYFIRYLNIDKQEKQLKGTVMLLR
jgi:gliding motility-associated-like protein